MAKPARIWATLDEFTVHNAAFLVCGIEPSEADMPPTVKQILQLMAVDYENGTFNAGSLSEEERAIDAMHIALLGMPAKPTARRHRNAKTTLVKRAEVLAWLVIRGIESEFFGNVVAAKNGTSDRNTLKILGFLAHKAGYATGQHRKDGDRLSLAWKEEFEDPLTGESIAKRLQEAAELITPRHAKSHGRHAK